MTGGASVNAELEGASTPRRPGHWGDRMVDDMQLIGAE